ncbi:MAG: FHA domain-containing protein [Myxococcota bacterium]
MARSLQLERFRQQLGPFVLVQRPPGEAAGGTDKMGLPVNVAATKMARPEDISQNALSLLFEFEELTVATLPPLQGVDELIVGRQPDCDLVIDDGSVSKRHARLRWDEAAKRCTVQDLDSTNGTFLNASVMVRRESMLRDGDILSFGDAQYWFLLTETLYGRLSSVSGASKLGSHSG